MYTHLSYAEPFLNLKALVLHLGRSKYISLSVSRPPLYTSTH